MDRKWILVSLLVFILIGSIFLFISECSETHLNQNEVEKIDKHKTEFTFAVYGDSRNSSGRFEEMLKDINNKNVLFSVHDGDMVWAGSYDEFRKYLKQIEISNVPVLTVIGNHELYIQNSSDNYRQIFGPTYYSFAAKNSYFIMVDDTQYSGLDRAQMDWLKNELIRGQKYKYRFVFFHVPLYDPSKGQYVQNHSLNNLQNAKELNNIFDKYNVTMIFTSHVHGYYNGTWGKTPFILTGGAGAPLHNSSSEHAFYHYILVHVTNDEVKYETVRF